MADPVPGSTTGPTRGSPGSFKTIGIRVPRGLSLVEILVALTLALFLVGGIIHLLVSSRATYRLAEAKARAQENGRYALHLLAKELRPSRSTACRNIAQEELEGTLTVTACTLLADPVGCTGETKFGTQVPLGYSQSQKGTADWLSGLPGLANTGTRGAVGQRWLRGDLLVFWGVIGEGFYASHDTLVTDSAVDLAAPIQLTPATETAQLEKADIEPGRLVMISDCEASDVFTMTDPAENQGKQKASRELQHGLTFKGSRVNRVETLAKSYNRRGSALSPGATVRARVFPFDLRVYFVCCMDQTTGSLQTRVANCDRDPGRYRPALCRWSASRGTTASLAIDVADMRVTYEGRLDPSSPEVKDRNTQVRFGDLNTGTADGEDGEAQAAMLPSAAWVQARGLWDQVASVRVEILVTGGTEVRATDAAAALAASRARTGLGAGISADKRLYEVFDTSIAIRARAPWYPD